MKKHHILKKLFLTLIILFIIIFIAFNVYASGYYHAENCQEYLASSENVIVDYDSNNNIWFKPKNSKQQAIVFYPGGLVEDKAYAPIMRKLADDGYTTVICSMPYNLAMLRSNAADKVIENEEYKDKTWYLAGHSLGGAFGARYYAKNSDKLYGLILFAAYSDKDLTNITDANVLQIYGSQDNIMRANKLEQYSSNLPSSTIEYIIEGGNHSYFGSYGVQKNDNVGTISAETQWNIATRRVEQFISK
jgi:hypothetical protein